jgi:hypothetical protein
MRVDFKKWKRAKLLKPHLGQALHDLLDKAQGQAVTVDTIVKSLAGRGYPVLLVLIALPFCVPIQIPGLSTPFGLLLSFMGLRIAFGKRLHWPKSLLRREISYSTLKRIVGRVMHWSRRFQKWLRPRFSYFVQYPVWHRLHGLLIAALGLMLALPLPIPFTNMLAALPIVLIGLGLLEDDGLWILAGYVIALLALAYLATLFWIGSATLLGYF